MEDAENEQSKRQVLEMKKAEEEGTENEKEHSKGQEGREAGC